MQTKIHTAPLVREDGRKIVRVMSQVEIINPITPNDIRVRRVRALWDTGATNTSIPAEIASELGITLGEESDMMTVADNTRARFCRYFLHFPTGEVIRVDDGMATPGQKTRLIIGMDIMSQGTVNIVPDGSGGVYFTFTL